MFCRFVFFLLMLVFVFAPKTLAATSSDEKPNDDDAVLSSIEECGVDTNGDKIVGGDSTELDEFPWLALMGYNDSTEEVKYLCGGSLINHRYVLTAAHCITGLTAKKVGPLVTIRLGEYDTRSEVDCRDGACADPPQEIPIQEAYAHPEFDKKNNNNDIGLVRLSRRAKYTYFVKPICLPADSTSLKSGTNVFVAGWGQILTGENSPIKQKLRLPIFDKKECVSKFKTTGININEKQLCAGGALREDTCKRDSGNPLMSKNAKGNWEAVGILSFGNQCGKEGWPAIYTSVTSYKDWILSTMKEKNS